MLILTNVILTREHSTCSKNVTVDITVMTSFLTLFRGLQIGLYRASPFYFTTDIATDIHFCLLYDECHICRLVFAVSTTKEYF